MKRSNIMITTAVGALLAGGLAATAGLSVRELPQRILSQERSSAPTESVLNTERQYGVKMFAATSVDCQHERAFVNFYSDRLYPLEKLNLLWPADGSIHSQIYIMHTGCHTPQGYFAMFAKAYTFDIRAWGWGKVNTETGEYELLQEYAENDPTYANITWEGTYDMAYNPYDNKTYGIYGFVDPKDNIAKSTVGTIDLATGKITKLKDLEYYYFCIAIDYDGIPYGVRWHFDEDEVESNPEPQATVLTRFTKDWEIDDEAELKVDGSKFVPAYIATMDFDYSTGDLYWGAVNKEQRQKLIKIDTKTFKTENLGSIGFSEVINGLYIPYTTADDRRAPARVSNLAFTPSADGSNEVTLSWTNPTKQWNGDALKEIGDGVEIYRDQTMTMLASVDGMKPGEAGTFTDKTATQGLHTYYLAAVNEYGLGVLDSIQTYVGRDVPGAVLSAKAVVNAAGNTVTLAWKKPAAGAHDGWYDQTGLKYKVVRMPDGKVLETALDGAKATITLKDQNIETVESYSYQITPYNADGEGTTFETEPVLAGTYVPVPYSTDFGTEKEAKRWTAIDSDGNGMKFEWKQGSENGAMKNGFTLIPSGIFNETLATPPMLLKGGKTYKVIWTVDFTTFGKDGDDDDTYTFATMLGTDPVYDKLTEMVSEEYVARSSRNFVTSFTQYFTSPYTATQYVALNVKGDTSDNFNIIGFSIEEEFDNDLMAEAISTPYEMVKGQDSKVSVTVHNNGKNTASNYKVQVCFGRDIVIGETDNVPTLKTRESGEVNMTVNPVEGSEGNRDLYARVVLANDQNSANDRSATKDVKILEANYVAVNHAVFQEENNMRDDFNTGIPMNHYNPYSLTQTIYPADVHGVESAQYIHRIGWEYTAQKDVKESEITVALGQNTRKTIASKTDWSSERQVVYQGTVSFREGRHYLIVDLPEPYLMDPNKTLVVTVAKYNPNAAGDNAISFPSYNFCDYLQNYEDRDRLYSIKNNNSGAQRLSIYDIPSSSYWMPEAPKLLLALHPDKVISGIEAQPAVFSGAIGYSNGALRFIGIDTDNVAVYDAAGRMVSAARLNGNDYMDLNVARGMYIVRVADRSGKIYTAKIMVR